MMPKCLIFLLLFSVTLVGCNTKKLEIENTDLNDKVKACGGGIGLSESLNTHLTNLHAAVPTNAKLGVGFNEQIELLLLSELSELPEKDRLKALEDYQRCIQNLRLTQKNRSMSGL
jgi:hypothetical protein